MTELFKVLSDPMRLEILSLLLKGNVCGCKIIDQLPITQPTLSYHLKLLTSVGLITSYRDKNMILHSVNSNRLNEAINFLEQLKDKASKGDFNGAISLNP